MPRSSRRCPRCCLRAFRDRPRRSRLTTYRTSGALLFHFRYSISELPGPGFGPRLADDRVGHFFTQVEDYNGDRSFESSRRYINRWRLEKQDPSASLSPPKQPIVFWMENTIPVENRDAIREGVLLRNKAFERIGFKDAVQVEQQPDNADWDPAEVRYSRALQRARLRKMVGMVVRDSTVPEDAQTLSRQGLISLRGQLQSALNKPGIKMSLETRTR